MLDGLSPFKQPGTPGTPGTPGDSTRNLPSQVPGTEPETETDQVRFRAANPELSKLGSGLNPPEFRGVPGVPGQGGNRGSGRVRIRLCRVELLEQRLRQRHGVQNRRRNRRVQGVRANSLGDVREHRAGTRVSGLCARRVNP